MDGPSTATGGTTALTREPSGRRASTSGVSASIRRPSGSTMRSITRRTWSSSSKRTPLRVSLPARSTYTRCGPLTIISVMLGSSSSGWIGPRPKNSLAMSLSRLARMVSGRATRVLARASPRRCSNSWWVFSLFLRSAVRSKEAATRLMSHCLSLRSSSFDSGPATGPLSGGLAGAAAGMLAARSPRRLPLAASRLVMHNSVAGREHANLPRRHWAGWPCSGAGSTASSSGRTQMICALLSVRNSERTSTWPLRL